MYQPTGACPILSTKAFVTVDSHGNKTVAGLIPCVGFECELWIKAYTDEGSVVWGCSQALEPKMVDGLIRV